MNSISPSMIFISNPLPKQELQHLKTEKPRNSAIDLFRLVAAYGVINIHLPHSNKGAEEINFIFSPISVPYFILVSLTYFLLSLKNETSLNYSLGRAFNRIIIPYLSWTIIYVFLLATKVLITGKPHNFIFWRILLYGESSVQIYFLPELFFLQSITLSIFFIFNINSNKRLLGIVLFGISGFYFLWGNYANCFGVLKPEAITFYIFSASLISLIINNNYPKMAYIITGIIIIISTLIIHPSNSLNHLNFLQRLPTGGVGLLFLAIGLRKIQLSKFWLKVISTSFGIFLCHVIFLEAFEFITEHFTNITINYTTLNKLIISFLIFTLSLIFTLFLRQLAITRKLFLGE
jgi:Acyltransferase family